MASLNLSGNNNNYYRIEAGDKTGTWSLTLPSQNDTLATLADVFQLGSPWKFRGSVDITGPVPKDADGNIDSVQGDAWVNEVNGTPNAEWVGLDVNKMIPKDALIVLDEDGDWHELSSSEIDPIFQNSPAGGISYENIDNWNEAFGWENHADKGYLTRAEAETLGYDAYGKSIWADPATQVKITYWDTAYGWGDHREGDNGKKYLTEETDPIFLASVAYKITQENVNNWNEAHGWGNHKDEKYLTEVKTLGSIGDVTVPTPKTDEVLTAVTADGVTNWVAKKVNVIVEGELIFKGAIDATDKPPKETPSAGHIYVHTGGAENPYDQYELKSDWSPVATAKYGDKLAYGDDGGWHVIGNAGIGTDLTSFNAVNSDELKAGGELVYDNTTGTFTYYRTDTFTQDEITDKLTLKANVNDVYKKSEVYNKDEVNALLEKKADVGDSYTKAEADAILQGVRQNEVVFLNRNSIDRGINIEKGWNGVTAGPVIIENGDAVIDAESEWTIVGGSSGGDVMTSIFDVKGSPMYAEFQAVKNKAARVSELEKEVQELKGMVKQLIKGIK